MREAVGGTGLIFIIAMFLVVYIAFMAVILNYGRVFRVKNAVINAIEQNEGVYDQGTLDNMARDAGYTGDVVGCVYEDNNRGTSYQVTVFINFQLPLLNRPVTIPVSGETRFIEPNVNSTQPKQSLSRCN